MLAPQPSENALVSCYCLFASVGGVSELTTTCEDHHGQRTAERKIPLTCKAAARGHAHVVRLLVGAGADTTSRNIDGETVEQVAANPDVKAELSSVESMLFCLFLFLSMVSKKKTLKKQNQLTNFIFIIVELSDSDEEVEEDDS